LELLIPVAVWSKAWVCCHQFAGIADSNPAGPWMSLVNLVFCQVEESESGWSPVQRSPTECGVTGFDNEEAMANEGLSCYGKKTRKLSTTFADPTRAVSGPAQPVLSPWLVIQRQCNWFNETVDMTCVYVFVMLNLCCSSLRPVVNNNYWNSVCLRGKIIY